MELCFGFMMKTVLITLWCFSCCRAVLAQSQGRFCFSHCPHNKQAGNSQGDGRGHNQDSRHKWPCRILCDVMHSNKSWVKELFVFLRNTQWAVLSWKWLNICLPMGNSEWIAYCALLAYTALTLPLSHPTSFLTSTLSILSLISLRGHEQVVVWGTVAHWG